MPDALRAAKAVPRPVRAVNLAPAEVVVEPRAEGILHLRSPHPLGACISHITERLDHWAAVAPDRIFLADRHAPAADGNATAGWRTITYGAALRQVRAIAAALRQRALAPERPLIILSGNDIEHALLGLAALYVGIPYAPVSPAYSLVSTDFAKLRHIINLLTPGLVFAADGHAFSRAIDAVLPPDIEVVVTANPPQGRTATRFAELVGQVDDDADVEIAHAAVTSDTVAKFLFTSGSTGEPKAVINTQRMLCSNQEMILSALRYLAEEPPVIVDWAPWHHTAGGNHDFGLVLHNGGTLYIDDGKPLPGAIMATVRNLREVSPTWYFNVPKGYEALLPFLRTDAELRQTFFHRLKVLWFAGAGIAQHVFDEMKELAFATCGECIPFLTGLGSTETAPFAFGRMWESEHAANIGLPPPGVEVKLVPVADKFEARLRGPSITPGYWRQPEMTAAAFDEEGFYRLGDTLRFADPADPQKGLLFEGRLAEDFKLATGTWVRVGLLRTACIEHLAPLARDVVIAGHDRDDIAILIFPDLDACARLAPDLPAGAGPATILAAAPVRAEFAFLLGRMARASTGSSNRVMRALLMEAPPSLDRGEMTDKGSINQRAVLAQRRALVEELYLEPPSPRAIVCDPEI
jgi:feruloyl-CoA synthase